MRRSPNFPNWLWVFWQKRNDMKANQLEQLARNTALFIREQFPVDVRHAIILGTGSGGVADSIEAATTIPYEAISAFPRSTAIGHKGQLICGHLNHVPVIAMQGRFHLYEGYEVQRATLPVHVMHHLGIKSLYVSNASGGLNPKMASGDLMLINSHIDLMFRKQHSFDTKPPVLGSATRERPSMRGDVYDPMLIERAKACGRKHGFAVHEGVYAALLGPNYETRAEYRMLRSIGADVAGMSTVPEVNVAAQYGISVLGISIVTNIANPDSLSPTSGAEVVAAGERAAPNLKTIVVDSITHQ